MADEGHRDNNIRIFLPLELQTALNAKSGARNIPSKSYILLVLAEHCKDILHPDTFKEYMAIYTRDSHEIAQTNKVKRERSEKRRKKRMELKERELALKEKNAESFKSQSEGITEKRGEEQIRIENQQKKQKTFKLMEERANLLEWKTRIENYSEEEKTKPEVQKHYKHVLKRLPEIEQELQGLK